MALKQHECPSLMLPLCQRCCCADASHRSFQCAYNGLSWGRLPACGLAARHPDKVKSLSLQSGWTKADPFIKTVVEGWQVTANALGNVPEMVILSIFP